MSRKDYLYAGLFLIIAIGFKGWRDGFTSQAAPLPSSTYLPLVRLLPVSKVITPPQGLKCLLQTNTTVVMDPQTQELIYSCEEKHGHGFIVFTKDRLIIDHLATGSGSLAIIDGVVVAVAVREDGRIQWQVIP